MREHDDHDRYSKLDLENGAVLYKKWAVFYGKVLFHEAITGRGVYRVVHLVAEHCLLTSNEKFRLSIKCNSYFNVNKRLSSVRLTTLYRVSQLLVHLGWIDLDLRVPPSCPTQAESGRQWSTKIQVNPTQVHEHMGRPVHVIHVMYEYYVIIPS